VRHEERLVAEEAAALSYRLLCAGARAAQAATPTALASTRLASSDEVRLGLDGLLDQVRQQDGDARAATGRFHPSPARKAL
jgi:hypothetical protein